ncbi:MAG: hypothetical protein IJ074_10890, partial [Clostridia bacterium]|nr:hypothetical protein [Clostridia bacterium]
PFWVFNLATPQVLLKPLRGFRAQNLQGSGHLVRVLAAYTPPLRIECQGLRPPTPPLGEWKRNKRPCKIKFGKFRENSSRFV